MITTYYLILTTLCDKIIILKLFGCLLFTKCGMKPFTSLLALGETLAETRERRQCLFSGWALSDQDPRPGWD